MTVHDYSAGRPGAANLAGAGCQGVVRYAGALTGAFNLDHAEVADLQAHGIPIGVVVEQQTSAILGGRARGQQLAHAAQANTRAVGLPDGLLWVAADDDFTLGGAPTSAKALGNMRAIADTLAGVGDVIGRNNVGIYGSYFLIDWLQHNAPQAAYWQTEAWSHGLLHPARCLYQRAAAQNIGGVSCDINVPSGDWHARGGHPAPAPQRTMIEGCNGPDVGQLQRDLNYVSVPGFTPLVADGDFGPKTTACVEQYQHNMGLHSDGVVGPVTLGSLHTLVLNRMKAGQK